MMKCHKCGQEWTTQKRVKLPGVKETCWGCNAYLHCCLNCKFQDPAKHNQCTVPNADWIVDKEGANFCDHFQFAETELGVVSGGEEAEARDALDALFGGGDEPSGTSRLDKFKDL